jgi:type II restriction enzyme
LEKLHPDPPSSDFGATSNRHVRDKIRQQLQVLRDTGFLEHLGSGEWRVK